MRGLLTLLAVSTLTVLAALSGLARAGEVHPAGKKILGNPAVPPLHQLKPVSWTEGSAYAWRGIFRVQTDGTKKSVYLCNPKNLVERIRLTPDWSKYVLREWRRYVNREVNGYSRSDTAPLDFTLLVYPEQ